MSDQLTNLYLHTSDEDEGINFHVVKDIPADKIDIVIDYFTHCDCRSVIASGKELIFYTSFQIINLEENLNENEEFAKSEIERWSNDDNWNDWFFANLPAYSLESRQRNVRHFEDRLKRIQKVRQELF